MRIALLGTRGVPARYGGFETAVEEVGSRLASRGHEVVVACRGGDSSVTTHLGMELVHLPAVRLKAAETLSHTALSVLRLGRRVDAAIVFNAANAPLLPLLRRRGVPTAVHVDGLEWKRAKWGGTGKLYYLAAERLAVRWADELIADARGIQQYYAERYGVATVYLPYGAPILHGVAEDRLSELNLEAGRYHLVVARLEPENLIDVMMAGYRLSRARHPLVVVGGVAYAGPYAKRLRRHAEEDPRVRMIGPVWDQELLDQLYAHAATYLHGHSVGGTNPSLLRAIGAGAPVLAVDVPFTREVLADTGAYFSAPDGVARLVEEAEADPGAARTRGRAARLRARAYDWDEVARGYESLCARLARRRGAAEEVAVAGARVA